jgi:hypothetical protein
MKLMDVQFLSIAVTAYYKKHLQDIISWKSRLTGGLVLDVLIARDVVQQALDFLSNSSKLSTEDKAEFIRYLNEVEQLDILLKQQAHRIVDSGSLEECRNNKEQSGWWWHLDKELNP